jgi:hypothetical protein
MSLVLIRAFAKFRDFLWFVNLKIKTSVYRKMRTGMCKIWDLWFFRKNSNFVRILRNVAIFKIFSFFVGSVLLECYFCGFFSFLLKTRDFVWRSCVVCVKFVFLSIFRENLNFARNSCFSEFSFFCVKIVFLEIKRFTKSVAFLFCVNCS